MQEMAITFADQGRRRGNVGVAPGSQAWLRLARLAKRRIAEKLGSRATYGEGTQNLLCALLAGAVLVGLAANAVFGLWWLDPSIALLISALCVREGCKARQGEPRGCASCAAG